jgi:CcmD family protein
MMRKHLNVLPLFTLLIVVVLTSAVAAWQPPTPPEGFVPMQTVPPHEQLPAAPLVIAAYAVAWMAVFAYLWSMWQRLGRVERELADVSRRVEAGERR